MKESDTYLAASIVCTFFGKAFLNPPAEQFLFHLRDTRLFSEWPLPLDPEPETDRACLEHIISVLDKQGLQQLYDDYNNLFIIPDIAVPVWESVWTTKERLLFSDSTFDVRKRYAKHGIAIPAQNKEPDDHFGLELTFVSHLLTEIARALEEGDKEKAEAIAKDARSFIEDHMLPWIDACLESIADKASTEYYATCARLCMRTIKDVADLLT